MRKHKVFVYGTLRNDQPPTHELYGYSMFAVNGKGFDFPFIQKIKESLESYVSVVGNIREVTSKELKALDKYEGVASGMYERIKVLVERLDWEDVGGTLYEEVWVYVGGPALVYTPIESGDWLNRGD